MSRCPRCEPVPEEVRRVADLLERRWTLSIIFVVLHGNQRFNVLLDSVPGISPRMLSERLRDLEQAGMIERRVLPVSPPAVEYRLTRRGRQLAPLIEALARYAAADAAGSVTLA
jgi:DNA-binding HxlR family transcriptional regulator